MHDEAAPFRFQIEGSSAGNPARKLKQAWRTALSVIDEFQTAISKLPGYRCKDAGVVKTVQAVFRN